MRNYNPLVSIVIPCYNHEQFVQDTIQSVIEQTYENIELIIIDDGSRDHSVTKIQEMVEMCEQRFVRFEFRSRPNKGLSATLNETLEWCQGKYYSPIASDDLLLPEKTKIQVNYLENNNLCVAVFGSVRLINKNNEYVNDWIVKNKSYKFEDIIMHNHQLLAPTAMLKLEIVKKVGGYNSSLYIEDWYMWLKLSKEGKIFSMNQIFALYRKHENNNSKNNEKMHKDRLDILELYRDHNLYKKAVKNIKLINAYEDFFSDEDKKFTNLIGLAFRNPLKLSSKFARKVFKIVVKN